MKTVRKSVTALVICVLTVISSLITVSADTTINDTLNTIATDIKYCAVYDMEEQRFLYTKNADTHISIASTTKLMTCLVVLSVFSPDDIIEVGSEINLAKYNSSSSYIRQGDKMRVTALLAALLLPSGNDAAYTAAVNTARQHSGNYSMDNNSAVKYFCNLMVEEAKRLGCENTYFVNPEGWDDPNHYSTVYDMTKIALAAADNAVITSIANIHSNSFYFIEGSAQPGRFWENTNLLLNPGSIYYYEYAHGLKTGSTPNAGNCLVAFAEKDGRRLLVLAYGCPYGKSYETIRFGKVKEIFEYVYSLPSFGDVDENGTITAADARLVLRASVNLEPVTEAISIRGDIERDGILNAADARHILRAAVNLENPSDWK